MISRGLLVHLDAKRGKEADVEDFLRSALPLVEIEDGTRAWFAVRYGRGEFGMFDVLPGDRELQAHLAGPVGVALQARRDELFDKAPRMQKVESLGSPSGALGGRGTR
jgi:hypothetical protein